MSEKNSNIDKVHHLISQVNLRIEEVTKSLIDKIYAYKEYPIRNGGEVDEIVNNYIDRVIKPENRVRLMPTIDIISLYGIISEIE